MFISFINFHFFFLSCFRLIINPFCFAFISLFILYPCFSSIFRSFWHKSTSNFLFLFNLYFFFASKFCLFYHDVFRVSNSSDDSSSELNLLPGFLNVDVVSTISTSMSDVSLHVVVEIEGTNVSLLNNIKQTQSGILQVELFHNHHKWLKKLHDFHAKIIACTPPA